MVHINYIGTSTTAYFNGFIYFDKSSIIGYFHIDLRFRYPFAMNLMFNYYVLFVCMYVTIFLLSIAPILFLGSALNL